MSKKKHKNYLALAIVYLFKGIYWLIKNLVLGIWGILTFLFLEIKKAFTKKPSKTENKEPIQTNQQEENKPAEQGKRHVPANYESFKLLKDLKGNFLDLENKLLGNESTIGIILGARGTAKSAIGLKLLENIHAKTGRTVYTMGFKTEDLPSWLHNIDSIDDVKNGGAVLLDESGITFSSRDSMSNINKLLSNLLLIARHKDLSLLFITQNCLPLTEKVSTPEGIKTLAELQEKGLIHVYDFNNNEIVSTPFKKLPTIKKKLVKIHLEDGRILKCSEDHKWFVSNSGKITEKKTKDLKISEDYMIDVSSKEKL